MVQIVLSTKKEADHFLNILIDMITFGRDTVWKEKENVVTCKSEKWYEFLEEVLLPSLLTFMTRVKEPQLLLSIIRDRFYFTDEDEQQQILHIAQSIIEGERHEIPQVKQFEPRESFLRSSFLSFLHPNLDFFMESFIRFRLNHYVERLCEYVEISIEEYKLEQEYQSFIQSLRDYIMKKEPKVHHLHILHEGSSRFAIYGEAFLEFSPEDLKRSIDRDFIYQHPMYIDSHLLAPLVSMAPKYISLYSDDQDEGMIVTIQNIFQERLELISRSLFYERKVSF
ncbi:putative sporulation protein YtxC [Bacillus kexueae]|uniref:putative sporulation protein YtxC n=1 Tax=Aeribacillus kexueae TaxID=2078952 RepID=UPI001FB048FF